MPLSTIFQLYRGGCTQASILITTRLAVIFIFHFLNESFTIPSFSVETSNSKTLT